MKIPDFKEPDLSRTLRDMSLQTERLSAVVVKNREVAREIYLQSPGGLIYHLGVSDAGTLVATYVSG